MVSTVDKVDLVTTAGILAAVVTTRRNMINCISCVTCEDEEMFEMGTTIHLLVASDFKHCLTGYWTD